MDFKEKINKWYEQKPQSVLENEKTKILWDFAIQCDKYVKNQGPDIFIVEKTKRECKIIDVPVASDERVGDKEQEKIEKYQDLKLEWKKLNSCQSWLVL